MIIPIKQILLEAQIHINDLDKKVSQQISNKILSDLHHQKFGSPLNEDLINEWRNNSNIVFNHSNKNPNKINGFIRTKSLPNNDENSKYYHALKALTKRNPNAINYISDLASIEKGTGKELLNSLPNKNPIVLRAWNKDLVQYYKQNGYSQLIHPELRGKLNMYKLNESTILTESTILNEPKNRVTVYGESHFHPDEVNNIRKQIIMSKPDIIVHEIPEEYEFFKSYLPNTRFYQLERGLDNKIYTYFKDDLTKQFEEREKNMIRNIDYAGTFMDDKPRTIIVVVGDTHLRTIDTPELGKKSPFYNRGYNIIRSKYKEIL